MKCPHCHSDNPEDTSFCGKCGTKLVCPEKVLISRAKTSETPLKGLNKESLFAREVLRSLVHKELLSPEWAERILSWRHTGFNVHSRVRARTKTEAERVGKYMIRLLSPGFNSI